MDCIVYGVAKSRTWLSDFHFTSPSGSISSASETSLCVLSSTLTTTFKTLLFTTCLPLYLAIDCSLQDTFFPLIFKCLGVQYLLVPSWSSCACCCCSVATLSRILLNLMDCSMPGFPVPHHTPEFSQTHVHCIGEAIQLSQSHPLLPSYPSVFKIFSIISLFQWFGSLHQVANVLELQLQHQSFQWVFRVDFR